jgi:hypothetical protein
MVLERSNQIIEMFHKLENSNHFYLVDCRCSTAIGAITFLLMLMLKLICCEKKYCYFAEMVRLTKGRIGRNSAESRGLTAKISTESSQIGWSRMNHSSMSN